MAIPPRETLRRLLAGSETNTQDTATLRLPARTLALSVDGLGVVPLPIRAPQAKKLISIAHPAHFGKGEETLLDTDVRDTWEVPAELVHLDGAGWDEELADALERLGETLGLQHGTRLRPEFHSLLVYGKGQFFAPHQDSEKHDGMVASLVVMLPSAHNGGELAIDDGGTIRQFQGSRDELVLVAFYADRRHQVLPVRTGHRVTATYNLVLETGSKPRFAGPADEASALLTEHFSTPVRSPYGRELGIPTRLAFLLDHEYSRHGLTPGLLKGADAERVALLRAAASAAECESALALAEVQETWDARPTGSGYRYYDDFDADDFDGGDDDYELGERVDGSVTLTWWDDAESPGTIRLPLRDEDVCAVTPSAMLQPYASEYEGFMGNYGNTVDRWYRRAALIVWPRTHASATRAEASPAWALGTVRQAIAAGDLERGRGAAEALAPYFDDLPADALPEALSVAAGVQDGGAASRILAPFTLEMVSVDIAPQLADLAHAYPTPWIRGLLRKWANGFRVGWRDYSGWVEATLPPLCRALEDADAHVVAESIVREMQEWLLTVARGRAGLRDRLVRTERLEKLGAAALAVLSVTDDASAATIAEEFRALGENAIPLLMEILRSEVPLHEQPFAAIAEATRQQLLGMTQETPRAPDDWSIPWSGGDDADAQRLAEFLHSASARTLEWPLAKPRRQAIHQAIDDADLPVRHQTRRTGSPHTLVLTKTLDLFTREAERRRRAELDLAWLTSVLGEG
ncbi:2OG-Fe(II) oxygenase [Tomitella gaofuii]|uniref:2OG-Fe(II) oxygenase n=1 Tax=Tomitella gaofuii TaxID=2760083 RepID=UPI0015FACE4B|nr:2OG-Fe(II) oxygenase [Tomitella gaofuii]